MKQLLKLVRQDTFQKSLLEISQKQIFMKRIKVSDLKNFKNADLSLVGEKGLTLSGGQRARINLARALYTDAEIYLLDDPLAAVDTKVRDDLSTTNEHESCCMTKRISCTFDFIPFESCELFIRKCYL